MKYHWPPRNVRAIKPEPQAKKLILLRIINAQFHHHHIQVPGSIGWLTSYLESITRLETGLGAHSGPGALQWHGTSSAAIMKKYTRKCWVLKTLNVRGPSCLIHPAVRDKRRVSEIDLSQPRHETAFWWRHNGPVTSQLTDPIKWRNYPFQLMFKCAYINTHNKESMTQRYRISTNVQLCLIFLYISIWFES